MNRVLMIVGVALAVAFLGGCAESRSELEAYIATIKQRPGKPLPPLPKMQEFETFEYAAHEMRDPLQKSQPTRARSRTRWQQAPEYGLTVRGARKNSRAIRWMVSIWWEPWVQEPTFLAW